ncbi:MAG: PQQ-binding-like beta-propeller repeat protein [Candidatus Bathyarchaeota archaeon]|nr:PQQ-binding-like beta-propeller repeat protein [Candidatus Bathyarchaeota archaeon]
MGRQKRLWLLIIPISLIFIQLYCISKASSANAVLGTDEWTMFRHDSTHSGYTTCKIPTNSVKLLWTCKTWKGVRWSSPAVANGCVLVGSRDWRVYCLNSSNGKPFWNYSTGNEIHSSPAIYNNSVYVGSDDGYVYCIDIATGKPVWKTEIGGLVRSSPTIVDGRLYIGSGNHDALCLNASNGAKIWRYPTSHRVQSSPAVSDGVVYVATDDYHVYAFNESTGEELWRTHTGSFISSPSVCNGYVYVGSIDGYICALNASTGAKIWEYQTEGSVYSSPAVAYGCVYAGSDDNNVYCLNASNGKEIWRSPTGYWVRSSPAVADSNVYVGSEDYSIYCFEAFTGATRWSYTTESSVDSSPAIVNGKLYVGSSDYRIYAFALDDSTVQSVLTQANNSSPWTTIAFDAVACVVAATITFAIMHFLNSTKQNAAASFDQKRPWFLEHANAICILAILAFSTIFFVNLGSGPLWVTDEQTYSQWAFHIFKTGDYLTPWAYGTLDIGIEKPPLFMWLISLAYQVFGVNNFASRIWSAVFGTLSLVLVFYLGKKLYNVPVGLLSALVLGTFTTFYMFARHAMTDVPFVFFILASVYFLVLSEKTEDTNRYTALGGVFFGLAFMTKQLIALLIPLITFSYFTATGRGIRFFFTKRFALFWRVGLLVIAPWVIYMILRFGPDFWHSFFVYSGIIRASSTIESHAGGYLYYFSYLVNNENPFWVVLLPFGAGLCAFNAAFKRLKGDTLIIAWIATVLAVFTFAQTKLEWYILPAFPAFAIAISSFLYQVAKKIQLTIRSLILKINSILLMFFP